MAQAYQGAQVMAAQDRLLTGTFGSILFDTGIIDAGLPENPSGSTAEHLVTQGSYLGTPRHDDRFIPYHNLVAGDPLNVDPTEPGFFATSQYVDLRDLLSEKECLDEIVINVQRMFDNPFPGGTYNMAPDQSIQETFMIVLGNMNLNSHVGQFNMDVKTQQFPQSGFSPADAGAAGNLENGLPFQVLYRENRRYFGDASQTLYSPNQMPSVNPPNPNYEIDRWTLALSLSDRTIGGYPNLVVGPGITIVRAWQVYPAKRTSQAGPLLSTPAKEYEFRPSRVVLTIPALQWNITGTQRALTKSEQAKWYTNILLTQN
jgi:hypothetical protein